MYSLIIQIPRGDCRVVMRAPRYATTRQKACHPCSAAKAKCDRKLRRCTRCLQRGLSCAYPQAAPPGDSAPGTGVNGKVCRTRPTTSIPSTSQDLHPTPECDSSEGIDTWSLVPELTGSMSGCSQTNVSSSSTVGDQTLQGLRLSATNSQSGASETLDFSNLEVFSPINVDDIRNRWLNPYVPVPGQKIKEYSANTTFFISKILKSYAAVTVHGRGVPPFVHSSQVMATSSSPPLSTCLSLVRMCEKPLPGSESVTADVLQREMSRLYAQRETYDDWSLLATFQAYLIYSMVLFFRLGDTSSSFLRQAMMNLQDLACCSSRQGVMCIAEKHHSRPRWEAWVVVEAKRRTLFTMYLFDNVLSALDGLQTFLGTELEGLPAPSNKSLWRAQTRHEWETEYNVHLVDWKEGGFRIDETWPIPTDVLGDEAELLERRNRVDKWLESVDEFGTMIYAVTSCTHGGI